MEFACSFIVFMGFMVCAAGMSVLIKGLDDL